jgi:hypothetical protein
MTMRAGAGGDDAALFFVVGEGEDFVERAALLEGSGALEVVELEEDLLAGHARELVGVRRGREIDVVLDALPGLLNIVQGYGHGSCSPEN